MRISFHNLLIVSTVLTVQGALANTVQVGNCIPNLPTYATISQAVTAVTAGSTVRVCPGSYPEQIIISQPLTLQGVQSGNAGNPTITVPSGGLTKSVVLKNRISLFFQIAVLNTESNLVNIRDLAVDGTNNGVQFPAALAGIYYGNSSGALTRVLTSNQIANRSGYGVFMESDDPTSKTISVSASSVRDFDAEGIRSNDTTPSSLKVSITSNVVITSTVGAQSAPNGIDSYAPGVISGNRILTQFQPGGTSSGTGIYVVSNTTVSNNTIAGFTVGISLAGNANTARSNNVSLAGTGMFILGNGNTVEQSYIMNLLSGGEAFAFHCSGSSNTVIHNVVNDSYWGIIEDPGTNIISPNTFSNVAQLISPPC